jgi:hypothetical protein
MRKYLVIAVGCAFLLFAVAAIAQTDTSGQYGNQSTSKTETQSSTSQSSTTTQMGANSGAQTIDGCLVREQTDYFLIPQSGNPIKVQASAGEDLSEHAGHEVKVTGTESALNAGAMGSSTAMGSSAGTTGAAASTPSTGSQGQTSSSGGAMSSPAGSTSSSSTGTGMASGTGNDMHRLADQQIIVVKLQHVAASCPANWNPKVPTPSSSSGMGPH